MFMLGTQTLLNRYANKVGAKSDYRLAKTLGVTPQAVSLWRHGKRSIGAKSARLIAAELGLDLAKVLAALDRERERNGKREKRNDQKARITAH